MKSTLSPTWHVQEMILCNSRAASYLRLYDFGVASAASISMSHWYLGEFVSLRLDGRFGDEVKPALRRIVSSSLKELIVCGSGVQDEWIEAVVQHCPKVERISFGVRNPLQMQACLLLPSVALFLLIFT